jgi:FOG: Ankyrin repeat
MLISKAVGFGDCDLMQRLIASNPNVVHQFDFFGMTPLHYASSQGHTRLAELLVASRSCVNQIASNGMTPLHYAVRCGHTQIVSLLLAAGAFVNMANGHGFTPTHIAACINSKKILAMLIDAGQANVNIPDAYGATPLHWACLFGYQDVAQMLIDAGALVNAQDSCGNTPIHIADINKHHNLVHIMIEKMEQEWVRRGSLFSPNNSIFVYNANIPIESMWIAESNTVVRQGVARSPQNIPAERGLWEIPVKAEAAPYLFSLIAHNNIYQWILPPFDKKLGPELMLVQIMNDLGVYELVLQKYEELADNTYNTNVIPLTNQIRL